MSNAKIGKIVRIRFDNDEKDIPFVKDLLSVDVSFSYDDSTTIRDLYLFLLRHLSVEEISQDELQLRFNIHHVFYRLDFLIEEVIKEYCADENTLYVNYTIPIPGGMGVRGFDVADIRINPSEKPHKYLPHVHIMPSGRRGPEIRIELDSLTQMNGDQKCFESVFEKKKREKIMDFLKETREELIDYYHRVQNGEYIQNYIVMYKGVENELR